jgi:hypothetical protein
MKKLIILLALFLAMPLISEGPNLEHLSSIKIEPFELGQKYEFASTEFLLSNRSSIGKHYSFNLSDIIDPYLKDLSFEQRSNVIIIAEDKQGTTQPFTYPDISMEYSMIPALLTFTKKMVSFPDTLIVAQDNGDPSGVDIDAVEEFFNVLTKRRIYLQLKHISEDDKAKIFKTTSVMFPVDKSTERWLTDLNYLHIYMYRKD